jgi:hypothetical protein
MSMSSVDEATTPLKTGVIALLLSLSTLCSTMPCEVVYATEFFVVITIGDLCLTCVRHCSDPSHGCILVSIDSVMVPFNEQESTPSYIQRVVGIVTWQLNWKQLYKLFERLPIFKFLEIAKEEEKGFYIKAVGDSLDEVAVIKGGAIVYCRIPLIDDQPNPTLMNQALMLIPTELEQSFYTCIFATMNGFVGLHNYQDKRSVISLSNVQGTATKLIVKDISQFVLEKFLKEPTHELVVIFTTGTPFSGSVGHLEFSCANYAVIRVDKERYIVPTGQWASLKNILEMF